MSPNTTPPQAPATPAARFICSICEDPSSEICHWCTKDACPNHLCTRCSCCSDCCRCEVSLNNPATTTVPQQQTAAAPPVQPAATVPPQPEAEAPGAVEPGPPEIPGA